MFAPAFFATPLPPHLPCCHAYNLNHRQWMVINDACEFRLESFEVNRQDFFAILHFQKSKSFMQNLRRKRFVTDFW